jgi:beta-glucosidase
VQVRAIDRRAQEDSRSFTWAGTGRAAVAIRTEQPLDISREATGELSLIFDYRVDAAPTAPVELTLGAASVPVAGTFRAGPQGAWRTMIVPLRCFVRGSADMAKLDPPFSLATAGRLALSISDIRIDSAAINQDQCGAP